MMSDYANATRIELFNDLTYDEFIQQTDDEKFKQILDEEYDAFVTVCKIIEANPKVVKNVTCYLVDGKVNFQVTKK